MIVGEKKVPGAGARARGGRSLAFFASCSSVSPCARGCVRERESEGVCVRERVREGESVCGSVERESRRRSSRLHLVPALRERVCA